MPLTILDEVPLLSMKDGVTPAFAAALGQSFGRFGFAIVRDHGLDPALVEQGWALAKAFFALPEAVKRRFIVPRGAGQRGYTPFGTEIARDASATDLKEFWHVGRDLPPGHDLWGRMPANLWPPEIPGFQHVFQQLFGEFDRVGSALLSAIALHLGLQPGWFDMPIHNGNSILRLLHYPPVAPDALPASTMGAVSGYRLHPTALAPTSAQIRARTSQTVEGGFRSSSTRSTPILVHI